MDENITCAKFAHMGTGQDQTYETNSAIRARCLPMLGKQRSHLGQASCPFSEDLLCLPMVDFFIFSKLAKWEICRIKRMKISLCHVFCILLPNDRQGRENK